MDRARQSRLIRLDSSRHICAYGSQRRAKLRPRPEWEPVMNGYELRMHDNVDLHMLLDRLHRNELDFRERLARRVEALGGLSAIGDPLYQRHYFALESLKAQRVAVESELSRREGLVD
jgi:hypothetical protein